MHEDHEARDRKRHVLDDEFSIQRENGEVWIKDHIESDQECGKRPKEVEHEHDMGEAHEAVCGKERSNDGFENTKADKPPARGEEWSERILDKINDRVIAQNFEPAEPDEYDGECVSEQGDEPILVARGKCKHCLYYSAKSKC